MSKLLDELAHEYLEWVERKSKNQLHTDYASQTLLLEAFLYEYAQNQLIAERGNSE